MEGGVFSRGRGRKVRGGCVERWKSPVEVRSRVPETESNVNVADDIFDFSEKAQLFSTSSPYPSDCVIILKDDKEVHVQRSLLFFHSKYFKELFAVEKSDRIDLDMIDHDEFVELLCVIYPSVHPITARNAETISKLAYGFEMPDFLKRCDVFLMTNNKKLSKSKLLLIAQDYGLKRLQEHYVKEYKYAEHVKAIIFEPEYASLNCQTRRMLLDNIIKSYMGPSNASHNGHNPYGNTQTPVDLEAKQADEAKIMRALISSTDCSPDIVLVAEDIEIQAHKQEEFARQYTTVTDVLKIKAEPEFEELDDKTRSLILDSITQHNGWRLEYDPWE